MAFETKKISLLHLQSIVTHNHLLYFLEALVIQNRKEQEQLLHLLLKSLGVVRNCAKNITVIDKAADVNILILNFE